MKNKKGFCIDCTEGSEEKFLIAKRCETHYWKHRKKINTEKTKSKPMKKAIPKISKKKQIENLKNHFKKFLIFSFNSHNFIKNSLKISYDLFKIISSYLYL